MAKIVKVVPLNLISVVSTGTTSYHVAAPNFQFLWLSDLYPNSKVYFEAVIDAYGIGGYYGYAALYTTGGAYVTGSELKNDTTTATRFRSGELSLTNNTVYELWLKSTNGGIPGNVYCASLVIIQEATPITATETQFTVGKYLLNDGANANYTDIDGRAFYYDAAQFDGTVAIYFEATLYGSSAGGTIYAKLYDTDGNAVADSEVSVTGQTATRVRSGAITLVDGRTYVVRMKHISGVLWDCQGARIIIQQTSNPTRTQTILPILSYIGAGAATSYTILKGRFYWDDHDWDVLSKSVYFETALKISNAAYTAYLDLYDGAAQVDERSAQATSRTRFRSAALNLTDNTTYFARYKSSSASGTATFYGGYLVILVEIVSGVSVKEFADNGAGSDVPKTDKVLSIVDTGAGAEILTLVLTKVFGDSGAGVDGLMRIFIKAYTDTGLGAETLIVSYPYPTNLKRTIIIIRGKV